MRAVVQRVSRSSVSVYDALVGSTDKGLLVFLGVTHEDDEKDVQYICDKVVNLRLFEDEEGKMNRSVLDIGGSICVVSQFTLYGDVRKGRRPNFMKAASPDVAELRYEEVVQALRHMGISVATGTFQAHMMVELVNDGPVTILLDSSKEF